MLILTGPTIISNLSINLLDAGIFKIILTGGTRHLQKPAHGIEPNNVVVAAAELK